VSGGAGSFGFGDGGSVGGGLPVVRNFIPTLGGTIAPFDRISFDVVAVNGISSLTVCVHYPESGRTEIAYAEGVFAPDYAARSGCVSAGYLTFTLARAGGWPSSPTVRALGADRLGNTIEVE
jgi:hypothetical protein